MPTTCSSFDWQMQRRSDEAGADFSFRIMTPMGRVKHLRGISQVIKHVADRPIFMGALQDVSDSKVAEEALNHARSELAHVGRVATLNAMTASITHEVSQPLSGILTNANTCTRMLAADPPNLTGVAETVRRITRDATRASEIIKRLRAMFSRKSPNFENIELNEAAREVITLSAGELQRKGARLQTDFAEDLPFVSADRVQLQQVILNLLLNAADAIVGVDDRPRVVAIKTRLNNTGTSSCP